MSISPPPPPPRPNNNQSTRILSGNSLAFLLAVRIVMKWLVRTPRGAFLKKINLEAQDYLASRWKEGDGGRGSERGGGELQPTRTSRSASQHQLLPSLPSHHPLLSAPHHQHLTVRCVSPFSSSSSSNLPFLPHPHLPSITSASWVFLFLIIHLRRS